MSLHWHDDNYGPCSCDALDVSAMVTFGDLKAGDKISYSDIDNLGGIYIGTITPHPIYPALSLVIWWMPKEKRYSFDALNPQFAIPGNPEVDTTNRDANLREAIFKS